MDVEKKISKQAAESLRQTAKETDEHVKKKNIFYRSSLDRLIAYEHEVNRIAFEAGLEVDLLLSDLKIQSPWEILNQAMTMWQEKLKRNRIGPDSEIIERLKREFQVDVRRTTKEVLPPDSSKHEAVNQETGHGIPDDRNRVEMAIRLLLTTSLREETLSLDDVEIIVGVQPKDSWRQRPYWIINIPKYNIAVFLNNQAGNRTFVVAYGNGKELTKMIEGTKGQLKDEKKSGSQIEHFPYMDEVQFCADLKAAIVRVMEKTVPVAMDAKYYQDPENIISDLKGFLFELNKKKKRKVDSIEALEAGMIRLTPHKCVNGEIIAGSTWLSRAAVALEMAKTRREASDIIEQVLNKLLEIAGIEKTEKTAKMDEKYFLDPQNIKKDLRAFLDKVIEKKKSQGKKTPENVEDLSTDSISKVSAVCANGELMNGFTYLMWAGKGLGMAANTFQAKQIMKEILDELKERIGIESADFPPMNREYFSRENILADLGGFAYRSGMSIEDLTTGHMDGTSVVCANGEIIEGKTYLSRATKALNDGDLTTPQAAKMMGKTMKDLKKMLGIHIEEYSAMDKSYFTSANIQTDLESLLTAITASGEKKNRIPQNIEELSTYDFNQISFVCSNGELIKGYSYLRRAARALNMFKDSSRDKREKYSRLKTLELLKEKISNQINK